MPKRAFILVGMLFCLTAAGDLMSQEPISQAYKQYYFEARQALQEKDYDRALEKINEAEADTPGKIPTLELRGTIYIERGQYDQAIADFEAILTQLPDYPGGLYNLGEAHFLKKDYVRAGEYFQQYLKLEGKEKNALVRYKVFLCDLMAGKTESVERQLKELQPTISHPLEYYCRAAHAYHREDQAGGDDLLNSAFRIYPAALNLLFAQSLEKLGFISAEGIPGVDRIDSGALEALSHEFIPEANEKRRRPSRDMENLLPSLE